MYSIFFLFLISFTKNCNSLKPHHLPNGELIKFRSDKVKPMNDFSVISPGKTLIITKNWLDNIVIDVKNNEINQIEKGFKKNNKFNFNTHHIISDIYNIQNLIKESEMTKNDLFLTWNPLGNHGKTEILFIVYLKLVPKNKELVVKNIIQSPFWDPKIIESNYLNLALEDLNDGNDNTTLILDYLYESDLRYKLSWSMWNLY